MQTKYLTCIAIFLLFSLCSGYAQVQKELIDKSVRFIYLVSKDRKVNLEYKKGVEMAAQNIQQWYKKQINATFRLNDTIVEVVKSDKNAAYFYSNPNGDDKKQWGFNNTLDECKRILHVKQSDSKYVWVIYSDGPGNQGMGGGGVCIMPEDDLLGLIGKHPQQPEINRWIAGLGHEIGHAFGLNHPKDTKKDEDAIMWMGIYDGKYPDVCYLTAEDKEILMQSPFFFDENDMPVMGEEKVLNNFYYKGGEFKRLQNNKTNKILWKEFTDSQTTYQFEEIKKDEQFYYIKAIDREISIKIPINGGNAYLSVNNGETWGFFQSIKK